MNVFSRLPSGRPKHELYNEILKLRNEGLSYDGIAQVLSVRRSTVASICLREGLGGRRNTVLNLSEVKKLRGEKRSYAAIARLFSVPLSTVKSACQKHGYGGKTTKNQYDK